MNDSMEEKLKEGVVFRTILFGSNSIKYEYYKILKIRKNEKRILTNGYALVGFTIKEMKFEKTHHEVVAVNEDSKETKCIQHYELKETNEKPKYQRYKFCDWHSFGGYYSVNKILEEKEYKKTEDIKQ